MKVLFLLLAYPFIGWSQDINLSPQGPEILRQITGRVIPNFQLVAVILCSPPDRPVIANGGDIFHFAAQQGFAWEAPEVADRILTRTAGLQWRNTLIFGAQVATGVMTAVAGGGIISASSQVVSGLSFGHNIIDQAIPFVRSRAVDPAVVVGLLIKPDTKYELSPKSCISGYIGAKYPSGPRTAVVSQMDMQSPDWYELALSRKEVETTKAVLAALKSEGASHEDRPLRAERSERFFVDSYVPLQASKFEARSLAYYLDLPK